MYEKKEADNRLLIIIYVFDFSFRIQEYPVWQETD